MLSENVRARSNNFDFLRFLAASLVIIRHTFGLSGLKFEPYNWLTGHDTFGDLALKIFFIISGFLITKSWSEKPNIVIFFKKRALRLMPALTLSVLFCVFIVGPLVTSLSLNNYFSSPGTYNFLRNIFLYNIQLGLPGVFANNAYPNTVNGSLWTLPIEFLAYCFVAIFGAVGIISRRRFILLFIFGMLFLEWYLLCSAGFENLIILHFRIAPTINFISFFFIGSAFYLYREKIPINGWLASVILLLYVISWRTHYMHAMAYISLPYLVLYIAYSNFPLNNFGKHGDFSYGIYVFSFPIQQTILHFYGNSLGNLGFFFFAFIITLLIAGFSWHFVEKPFLGRKNAPIFQTPIIGKIFRRLRAVR